MQWIKDASNKWALSTNDIAYSDFKENLKPTSALGVTKSDAGKAIVYVPTHNIHDVYEWYRMFRDSYLYTDDFDTYGHAIHGYFSKERGESIKGWFPNLIEVKAASSPELRYYSSGATYNRCSIDYVMDPYGITELVVDGVKIFNEELVLLMHQYYETVTEHAVLADETAANKYCITISAGDEQYFAVGNPCVIKDASDVYHTATITGIETLVVGIVPYLLITTDTVVENPDTFADLTKGAWAKTSFENTNGVYQYFQNTLTAIPEMSDKYKTYGQIAFVYQGTVNENKEFYLRRSDIPGTGYGQFPQFNGSLPMAYSEGDAYLIKCELDYNLDPVEPLYPSVPQPYGSSENAYRLLFLDPTMADKVMTTNANGIGDYQLVDTTGAPADVMLGDEFFYGEGGGFSDVLFNKFARGGSQNALYRLTQERYRNSPVQPVYKFRSMPLDDNMYLDLAFTTETLPYANQLHSNTDVFLVQNKNTTSFTGMYDIGDRVMPGSINIGDLINLKFTFYDAAKDLSYVAMDEQFVVVDFLWTSSGPTIEVFPKMDDNFIHEFNTYNKTATYNNPPTNFVRVDMGQVNTYGIHHSLYVNGNESGPLLVAAINKSIVGKLYDLNYYYKSTVGFLELRDVRQGHGFKWENQGSVITAGVDTYSIDSTLPLEQRIYFKGHYDIVNYLSTYLDCFPSTSVSIAQLQDVTIPYNNILNATDRFGVEGSNKIAGYGSTILFGPDYKELIMDNIKKDTLVNFNPALGTPAQMWIAGVEWDAEKNLGTVKTLGDIPVPAPAMSITLEIVRDIPSINTALVEIFGKTVNQTNNHTAYESLNQRIIPVAAASTANVSITSAPATIDGYTLKIGDLVILKNQTTALEKRIYAFNGTGKPFVRYDVNTTTVVATATANVNIASAPAAINGVTLVAGNRVSLTAQTAPSENRVYTFVSAGAALVKYETFAEDLSVRYHVQNGSANLGSVFLATFTQPLTSATLVTFTLANLMPPNVSYDYPAYMPDTASYAYAMLNYGYDDSTTDKNTKLLEHLTGIVYKEYGEPRISLLKRDKSFLFNNGDRVPVVATSTANVNILSAPASVDGVALSPGDLILLKDQTLLPENGLYVFDGAASPLVDYGYIHTSTHWVTGTLGTANANKVYQAQYTLPLVRTPLTTPVTFVQNDYTMKMDSRLTMKPLEIAKLGVDNRTQPWKKINNKYDSIESEENVLNIEIGINNRHRIRFIDGLTEANIIGNILGQGQYDWILDEGVIVDDAVVGCTQDAGPGTGTLIWYTGTWVEGVWVDGIWIQGTWEAGTWLNGTWNAYPIQDYYYYVTYSETQNNILSTWETGVWNNGTFNGGIAHNISWLDGTFNGGVITEGTWATGTFNNGIINHIVWTDGTFNGGDFETGLWKNGLFQELDPTKPARFGTKADGQSGLYADRAIWQQGIFDGGEFWSGLNYFGSQYAPSADHSGSVWYSGEFRSGDWYGGSFVVGVFKNGTWHGGVWFGGFYIDTIADLTGSNKRLTINPNQYDDVLGLSATVGFQSNSFHRLHTYYQTSFQLIGLSNNTPFAYDAFINRWDETHSTAYTDKLYVPGSGTYNQIDLTISSNTAAATVYQVADPVTHTVDGRPFICAVFKNATWKGGVWLNGYFTTSIWECGSWINGWMTDSTFGLNNY